MIEFFDELHYDYPEKIDTFEKIFQNNNFYIFYNKKKFKEKKEEK